MQKGSILTSSLIYKKTWFPQNTLTSQTLSGPLIPMVYYAIKDESMFQILTTYDYVFSNTRMTIHLQVIMVKPKPFIKSVSITIGPDFWSSSKTTANHAPHVPMPNPCTTNP